MKPVYLDTNIVLDLLDSRRSGHDVSRRVIETLLRLDVAIVISEDMLTTIYYIAKEKQRVLAFFQVVLREWRVEAFGPAAVEEAVKRCMEDPALDFEDVLQCLCAKNAGCGTLVTNDRNFHGCGVEIVDGAAALAMTEKHLLSS